MPESAFFRANVGIVVHDPRGRVLALERVDVPGAWQMPQGGIDEGEDVFTAALRELEEETGIAADRVRVVTEHPSWLVYESPRPTEKCGLGQAQKWVLVEFLGDDSHVRLDLTDPAEFRSFRWTSLEDLAREVVPFKRHVYEAVWQEFGPCLRAASGG